MTNLATDFYRLDPLTGCNNFLSFMEALDRLSSAEERRSFSILYLDMNYMGTLNQAKGQPYGDSVLRWLGIVLQEECRSPAYGIGGDEFIVVLPNTFGEGAKVVAERFRSAIKEASKAWVLPSSISIGIATYPKHGSNTHELVGVAESALKRAKDEGKDRVILAE